jgi:hypothetical protein
MQPHAILNVCVVHWIALLALIIGSIVANAVPKLSAAVAATVVAASGRDARILAAFTNAVIHLVGTGVGVGGGEGRHAPATCGVASIPLT